MSLLLPTAANQDVEYEDFYETTLQFAITESDTDIYPQTMPQSAVSFLILGADTANPEIIFFNETGADYVRCPSATQNEGRGCFGTDVREWAAGTKIGMYSTGAFFELLATGKGLRNGSIEARHFSSGIDPNSWLGIGVGLTYGGNNGNHESYYTATGDQTTFLQEGMKIRLPRTTSRSSQSLRVLKASSQYAVKTSPANISFTTTFTCEADIYVESLPASGKEGTVVSCATSNTAGWSFALNDAGRLVISGFRVAANNRIATAYQATPLNKWIHVAASLDMTSSGACTMYIDQVAVNNALATTGTATALVQSGNLQVGARDADHFFDGRIKNVRVWSEIRSEAQIKANCGKVLVPADEPTLVSYFPFDGNSEDQTSNNNDLTLQASATDTYADSPYHSNEYGRIVNIDESGGTTTMKVFVAGIAPQESITGASYSGAASPYGFPVDPESWRIYTIAFSEHVQSSPVTGTWYNNGNLKLYIGAGHWNAGFRAKVAGTRGSTGSAGLQTTLATSAGAETDKRFTYEVEANDITGIGDTAELSNHLTRTTGVFYYLNERVAFASSTLSNLFLNGDRIPIVIWADLAYP